MDSKEDKILKFIAAHGIVHAMDIRMKYHDVEQAMMNLLANGLIQNVPDKKRCYTLSAEGLKAAKNGYNSYSRRLSLKEQFKVAKELIAILAALFTAFEIILRVLL